MAIRSIENLRWTQQRMLEEFRLRAATAVEPPRTVSAELEGPVFHVGRVSEVVTSDETYGPHVMVVPQRFSGTPPTASDGAVSAQRAHPTPNNSVSAYSVDDYVAVWVTREVRLAVRLA